MERTAPSGGGWGSKQQPPWWNVLPLTMVGSVSDPQVTELITTVNDSAFWEGKDGEHPIQGGSPEAATGPATGVAQTGFRFAGVTKPLGLTVK